MVKKLKKHYKPRVIKTNILKPIKSKRSKKFFTRKKKKKNQKRSRRYLKKLRFKCRFLLKKKKLNVIYKNFNLNKYSLNNLFRRKMLKKKLKQYDLDVHKMLKFLKFNNLQTQIKSKIVVAQDIVRKKNLDKDSITNKLQNLKFSLNITVCSNNIFINLTYTKKKKTKIIKLWSAGMFKFSFSCSKKKLKFILFTMLKSVRFKLKHLFFYTIKIKAPKYLNKYIFRQLLVLKYKTKLCIYNSFKIFNGCRSKKKRRKKRLRYRFFR